MSISSFLRLEGEIVSDENWVYKEFIVPREGVIKRVRAGCDNSSAVFDVAVTTSKSLLPQDTILKYKDIDINSGHLDASETIYYLLNREARAAIVTNDQSFRLKTSSKKTIYLKVYSIKKFKKVYFNFTVQDHEDAYNLLREEVVIHRSIASRHKLNGNFFQYSLSRKYVLLLEAVALQHKDAKDVKSSVSFSSLEPFLPIWVWVKSNSNKNNIWFQLDIENSGSDTILSEEATSSIYRVIPEGPKIALAKIDLTDRLDDETKTFLLNESIQGDVVMLSLNGQMLNMGTDFTFDETYNSVTLIEPPETTDVVVYCII
jgi:hypothetical protein